MDNRAIYEEAVKRYPFGVFPAIVRTAFIRGATWVALDDAET